MQSRMAEFSEKEGAGKDMIEIFADSREAPEVIDHIRSHGVIVNIKQLDLGDYLLSDRMVVERKTASDFEASIVDGRLFEQAGRLEDSYDFPILIIEGQMKAMRIHQSAFMGAYMAMIIDFGLHVINTGDEEETAKIVYLLAKREQLTSKRPVRLLAKRKTYTLEHQQLRVLEAFPTIGPIMARKLLAEFGSLEGVFRANQKRLEKVLGKAKAGKLHSLLHAKTDETG
ncbi:3'-flap repair endonuclease Xpf [uncultured archaeon]|nr:3'-flap repair endonuclease Xpf [uncultured archaeon]